MIITGTKPKSTLNYVQNVNQRHLWIPLWILSVHMSSLLMSRWLTCMKKVAKNEESFFFGRMLGKPMVTKNRQNLFPFVRWNFFLWARDPEGTELFFVDSKIGISLTLLRENLWASFFICEKNFDEFSQRVLQRPLWVPQGIHGAITVVWQPQILNA